MADPYQIDPNQIAADQEENRRQKAINSMIGAISDNLASRQSWGNFASGHLNAQSTAGSKTAEGLNESMVDPLDRQQKMLTAYRASKEGRKLDRENQIAMDKMDSSSTRSGTMREMLTQNGVKVPENMSEEQIKEALPFFTKKMDADIDIRKAQIAANAKVPKGFEYQIDPATGDKTLVPSEAKPSQYQAATYGKRMEQANNIFSDLAKQGYDRTSNFEGLRSYSPINALKGENLQQQEQAERNFVNSLLRRESGSAIAPSEFASAEKQYFPRSGDDEKTLENKAENRRIALSALLAEGAPAMTKINQTMAKQPGYSLPQHRNTNEANAGNGQSFNQRDIEMFQKAKARLAANPNDQAAIAALKIAAQKGLK